VPQDFSRITFSETERTYPSGTSPGPPPSYIVTIVLHGIHFKPSRRSLLHLAALKALMIYNLEREGV
jgi:hypothetical protein